jgi:hypothetical protein
VTDLHLHDLRGEAGSQLLEAGVPMHEVRDAYLRTRSWSLPQAYAQRTAHRARQGFKRIV